MKILSDDEIQKVRDDPEPRLYSTKLLEAQHKDTLRQVRELLDGIENPYGYYGKAFLSHDEIVSNKQYVAFEECRQRIIFRTMKALLEE